MPSQVRILHPAPFDLLFFEIYTDQHMGLRDKLGAGDIIADCGGFPVIRHWDEGSCDPFESPRELRVKHAVGEVSPDRYARILRNRSEIMIAYYGNASLPDGASVIPPSPEDVRDMAHILSADLFYKAMQHARRTERQS